MTLFGRHKAASLGAQAEANAAKLLVTEGYHIVERNYRCRLGEIDIIALGEGYLVFGEVRHRSETAFGKSVETVDCHKQKRLIATAKHFLSRGKYSTYSCRFDFIGTDGNLEPKWLKNAFQLN